MHYSECPLNWMFSVNLRNTLQLLDKNTDHISFCISNSNKNSTGKLFLHSKKACSIYGPKIDAKCSIQKIFNKFTVPIKFYSTKIKL